eukprot:scaffold1143_cov177-Amphora_coffeaeformis.AAC.2
MLLLFVANERNPPSLVKSHMRHEVIQKAIGMWESSRNGVSLFSPIRTRGYTIEETPVTATVGPRTERPSCRRPPPRVEDILPDGGNPVHLAVAKDLDDSFELLGAPSHDGHTLGENFKHVKQKHSRRLPRDLHSDIDWLIWVRNDARILEEDFLTKARRTMDGLDEQIYQMQRRHDARRRHRCRSSGGSRRASE